LNSRISGYQGFLELLGTSPASRGFHHKVKEEDLHGQTRAAHAPPEFKARVALAALRDDKTLAQLCEGFDLHANQISECKRQLVERVSAAFDGSVIQPAVDLIPLQAKIGQLTLRMILYRVRVPWKDG
jgi:transposase